MYLLRLGSLVVLNIAVSWLAWGQSGGQGQNTPKNGGDFSTNMKPQTKVPAGVILVKGAWSSANDSVIPLPEDASVSNNIFNDRYFGMTYALPKDWIEKYKGPPPSDNGRYVLAQIRSAATAKGSIQGSILITAQDLFFNPLPVATALDLIHYRKDNLQNDYAVELPPTQTKIAGRPFVFFAYWSPVAELHWYVLATEIRCHVVEVVLTSHDTKLLSSLFLDMNNMKLPTEANPAAGTGGGSFPVCIKDYARKENVMTLVDPVFPEHRFNSVPVRIIIDKEGNVKHIHVLSAFPDQAKAITDALLQWKFKPYLRDGEPCELETGILFGRAPYSVTPLASGPPTQ